MERWRDVPLLASSEQQLETHPPSSTTMEQVVTSRLGRRFTKATFLLLGAESSVTLSTVCLAAAYFKDSLGAGVVGALITAHCSILLSVMSFLLIILPSKVSAGLAARMISICILYALCFNIFTFVCVLLNKTINGTVLYILAAVNGGASGLVQIMSSRLGGDLPTTMSSSVANLQLVGVSLAQWLPGLIQAILLPYAAQPGQAAAYARVGALLSVAAAAVLCFVSVLALQVCSRLFAQSLEATANNPDDAEERCKYISHVLRKPDGWSFIWHERVVVLAPMASLIFVTEATFTLMLVLSPRLPIGGTDDDGFWHTYQPTLLIMCANAFSFFGRASGLHATASVGVDCKVLTWCLITPAASILTVMYWRALLPQAHIYPIILYSATALVNGFTLVLLNKSAQAGLPSVRTGAHGYTWNPCPIAAQLVWFALQLGAFLPAAISNFLT